MAMETLDLCGLQCPQPAMKVAQKIVGMKKGDVLEAVADCETFESDMKAVCNRWKKVLMSVKMADGKKIIAVQI